MIRIAVVSPKGGVGKSTISYYLSKILSDKYKVVLVDRDLTATISSIFGIKIGILNYLADDINGEFVYEDRNLKVVSLARFQPSNIPPLEKFYVVYKNILNDADIIITDNSPGGIGEIELMEYKAYYKVTNDKESYFIPVTTPALPLQRVLIFIQEYKKILKLMVPESSSLEILALVANMVKNQDIEVPGIKTIKIPFYKDLLYNGFQNCEPPKELYELVKLVEKMIY
ncbi:Iron-sulfur cluster carrier protein [Metallosphaera sp. J1]|uniref:tyrosine-protein kinase family protein n=1 Tax=Metallosphaera javensis (ex Hofmann et al. 2022) TaxID=99938 RepID=UPI001EDE8F21|nr:ParA family protein [Metallosphaera javensis (ex Hofmann et al. 2022)]MCG3110142.1 Iron-sulfur cluster carrier protein [Metallosphaera javensis (ex Hofmann et al. 2022)]